MSEQFRNLRHLTAHVEEQKRIFCQLSDAITSVSALLDSIPEKERQVRELDERIAVGTKKLAEQDEAHRVMAAQFRQQRHETAELVKKEQQERVTARESFRLEQQSHRRELEKAEQELAGTIRQIGQKQGELETLEKELASTVKAVLRR